LLRVLTPGGRVFLDLLRSIDEAEYRLLNGAVN
jgi:hypothetical protein